VIALAVLTAILMVVLVAFRGRIEAILRKYLRREKP